MLKTTRAELCALLRRADEALQWCGGALDFGPGGQAHVGWQRTVVPLQEAIGRELTDFNSADELRDGDVLVRTSDGEAGVVHKRLPGWTDILHFDGARRSVQDEVIVPDYRRIYQAPPEETAGAGRIVGVTTEGAQIARCRDCQAPLGAPHAIGCVNRRAGEPYAGQDKPGQVQETIRRIVAQVAGVGPVSAHDIGTAVLELEAVVRDAVREAQWKRDTETETAKPEEAPPLEDILTQAREQIAGALNQRTSREGPFKFDLPGALANIVKDAVGRAYVRSAVHKRRLR